MYYTIMKSYVFGTIIFDYKDENITILPMHVYKVTKDESIWSKFYIVVVYKIRYFNKVTEEEIESIIPYYLSDGHNNGMRADMLYPFLSFNISGDNTDSLFTDYIVPELGRHYVTTKGGILKINIIKNINMNILIKLIEEKYIAIKGQKYLDEIRQNYEDNFGVSTILVRIQNILDFLIAINSRRILEYKEERLEFYRPVLSKGNEINWHVTFNIETQKDINDMDRDDPYRKLLLEEMQKFIELLTKYILKAKYGRYNADPITMRDFNKKLQMCKDMKVTDIQKENIHQYVDISEKLNFMINNMVNDFKEEQYVLSNGNTGKKLKLDESAEKQDMEEKLSFYKKLEDLLYKETRILDKDSTILLEEDKPTLLERNIASWHARCYRKYMKYKLKYLNLQSKFKTLI